MTKFQYHKQIDWSLNAAFVLFKVIVNITTTFEIGLLRGKITYLKYHAIILDSGSKQIYIGIFIESTKYWIWSRVCKSIRVQS